MIQNSDSANGHSLFSKCHCFKGTLNSTVHIDFIYSVVFADLLDVNTTKTHHSLFYVKILICCTLFSTFQKIMSSQRFSYKHELYAVVEKALGTGSLIGASGKKLGHIV